MQTFLVIKDAFGGEVRLPVNVEVKPPATAQKFESEPEPVHCRRQVPVKRYTPDFRQRAVDLVLSGVKRASVLSLLNIPDSTLDSWLRQRRGPTRVQGVTTWSMT